MTQEKLGVGADLLARTYPVLYHMAERDSWPSIRAHGLLSTRALLDLFKIEGAQRAAVLRGYRPESIVITREQYGRAVIRDQKPMDDGGLRRCLQGGMTPPDWYDLLNQHVFFWVSEERLRRMLRARAYRDQRHVVLRVDTAALLARHVGRVVLSAINSGATKPFPQPRGPGTFAPIEQYPFEHWCAKRRLADAVVELAVLQGVPDIRELVIDVRESGGHEPDELLWAR